MASVIVRYQCVVRSEQHQSCEKNGKTEYILTAVFTEADGNHTYPEHDEGAPGGKIELPCGLEPSTFRDASPKSQQNHSDGDTQSRRERYTHDTPYSVSK